MFPARKVAANFEGDPVLFDQEIIHAHKRSGVLLGEDWKDCYDPSVVAECEAAIHEYFANTKAESKSAYDSWVASNFYSFEGESIGPTTIRLAGRDVTRPFKLAWKPTPEWEHFDD